MSSREERLKLLKQEIDEFVANGGNIQDDNKNIPYYNRLRSFLRNDRRSGIESTIASVYKESGYNYIEKKKPRTIERLKEEIDEYVRNGGSIFDPVNTLPYMNSFTSFLAGNKGWSIKDIYEACGYEYRDKPEPLTIEKIKRSIDEYVKNGGSIYDSRNKLPYINMIGHYIQNHKENKLTIDDVYRLCGYEYDSKKTPITVERIKAEIDEYVKNGGDIYDKKENIPYYDLMQWFIERNRRNGVNYGVEEVYKLCGYEYNSVYYNTYKLGSFLKEYKNKDGFVDSIKESDTGRIIFDRLQDRAQALKLDVNDYLMCMYGVRVSNSFSSVDYFSIVQEGLKKFENLYGYDFVTLTNIYKHDVKLYNKIRHLGMFFPEGAITQNDVLYFFGYEDTRRKVLPKDEEKILKQLKELYPDGEIKKLSLYPGLYTQVVRLSALYDKTVKQYLELKGFKVNKSQDNFRLSKAKVETDNEQYKAICNLRKKLIGKSKVLNNPNSTIKEINKELENIGLEIVKSMNIELKPVYNKPKH